MATKNAINENRAADTAPTERALRVDLAACFRLIAHYGWDDLLATHVSARLPGPKDEFLINPYGILFHEITASSLLRIDTEGRKLSESPLDANPAGFTIHSAIHMARPDAGCVIHLHTTAGVAVSALRCGLLPMSQTAMTIAHDVVYHDYEGFATNLAERERLQRDIGSKRILMLRNHGTLVVGATIAEAFVRAMFLEKACDIQLRALATGQEIVSADPAAIKITADAADSERVARTRRDYAWPGLLRMLDRIDDSYKN